MQQFLQIAVLLAALIVGIFLLRPSPVPVEPVSPDVATESPVEKMLLLVESKIANQEDRKDVRCWSSVNKIQTFLSGMPIEPEVAGQRVERYVTLIDDIWNAASDQTDEPEINEATLIGVFKSRFPNRVSEDEGKVSFNFGEQLPEMMILEESIEDYGDTIESWRLLQSWALRKASLAPESTEAKSEIAFSEDALNNFRDLLVVYDIALLKMAKEVAQERKLASVDVESMNIAFDKLLAGETVAGSKDTDDRN